MRIRTAAIALVCAAASGCFNLGDGLHVDPPKPFFTRQPVEDPGPALVEPAQWTGRVGFSSDDTEVLYTVQEAATDGGDAPFVLHGVRVADGGQRTIDTGGASALSFSPTADGAALYVVVADGSPPSTTRVLEAFSGAEVALGVVATEVVPSPSGRRLLVRPVGDGTAEGQLWRVVDLDGGILRVTPCADAVTFSPGSDEIACGPMEGLGIVRQRLSDGAVTRLAGLHRGWPSAIRWSAEGMVAANFDYPNLLFGDPATSAVAARSAAGPHAAVTAWPALSGDGRIALYREGECLGLFPNSRSCDLSEHRLMMVDLETGEITTLASSAGELVDFALSGDGATAAYLYCAGNSSCALHVRPTGR